MVKFINLASDMKTQITFLITFLSVFNCFSQVTFGVKAGVNLSSASESYSENISSRDLSMKPGFQIGMWSAIPLVNKLSLLPELVFAQEGYNWNDNIDRNIHLYYLNLNLLLSYRIIEKVSIEFGPQVSKIIKANYRVNGKANNYNNNYSDGLDLALMLGGRLNISSKVGLGLRYIQGLNDISEEVGTINSSQSIDIDQKKFGIQLSLYLGF
jgi:hypothetical protein